MTIVFLLNKKNLEEKNRDENIDSLERSILYYSAEHSVGKALSQADAIKLGWLIDRCRRMRSGKDKIVKDEMLQTKIL